MKLEHSFTVPTGIEEAWRILLDIELIGPCMPGAAIDSVDGDDFTGTVKVKLGPIGLTYKGKASFVEKDEAAHRAVIDARGRDARGNGTASAKVTAHLQDQGGSTLVKVDTDLDITGKPAQFGRGVMVDVGNKLIGQFADNLATTISESGGAPSESPAAAVPAPAPAAAAPAPASAPAASAPAPAQKAAKKAAQTAAKSATKSAAKKAAASPAKKIADGPADADTPTTAGPSPAPSTAEATGSVDEAPPSTQPAAPATNGHRAARPVPPARDVEPINLIESAGPAVAKRLAPLLAALAVLVIVLRRRAKR
ncbi:SRPBCC family protein [uncultured Jatrophihabitans sp.]|uniref:SRPBCC family protein n=1 Tax=uncultured Jatrophihabitans sp. TaxID=1610747 RepID=UPI0035CB379B